MVHMCSVLPSTVSPSGFTQTAPARPRMKPSMLPSLSNPAAGTWRRCQPVISIRCFQISEIALPTQSALSFTLSPEHDEFRLSEDQDFFHRTISASYKEAADVQRRPIYYFWLCMGEKERESILTLGALGWRSSGSCNSGSMLILWCVTPRVILTPRFRSVKFIYDR